ncbi:MULTISPECIES: protein-L-isoaspartate O-methyltransferase family protein [Sphingomonas]|jgi:protein-L-isoaspartate(D-aspartate) O-methyltransferase|uniref:Protein-L-isoaspartate O-methyltransferase n=1 Tax=Sphingomonas hankookensis TaxID=563996 RepID=A0ABR5YHH1_9SPHN|nr:MULTISPECIES: protein-L-isoaspartate O-methyltransferase [Sphingomonas]KZE18880.1 protein-L-isoaspartate O-methyltransferase [Sphingomonas hankookensis]PZT93789.1 MAG: protein-L-isoaspartate O-methyltransferase [Sphingomonas sp.]WCP70793.1 protein-L-isoaspartate O-methyltransferase [Sphingomonas hankookensis]
MTDSIPTRPDFDAMRHAMVVSQLRTSAVSDVRVVSAMGEVPREVFVPPAQAEVAYRDAPLPLSGDRAINPPLITGRLLTAAEVQPTDRVLLVGAAMGYAAAVLARLAGSVVALEEDAALAAAARDAIADATVEVVEGPLNAGWAQGAPYDVIVIDGAVESVPDAIVTQLAPGGRLTTGIVDRGVTRLALGRRTEGGFGLVDFADLGCVELPGFAKPKTFQFAR